MGSRKFGFNTFAGQSSYRTHRYDEGRLRALVPEIEPLFMGTCGLPCGEVSKEHVKALEWCVDKIAEILDEPNAESWTERWLQVSTGASQIFN